MKRFIKYCTAIMIAAAILAVGVFAAEGDYGYYDKTEDGEISAMDVVLIVSDILNDIDSDATLLKALKALKISVSAETVTAIIKSIDYTNSTATVLYEDNEAVMSFAQLGLDKVQFTDLYEEGLVKMTVPSPAKDFFASFDAKNVYAAKIDYRYYTNVLECTVGSADAKLNGAEITLAAAPVSADASVMLPVSTVKDIFEIDLTEDENSVAIDGVTYVAAELVAENVGMKFVFDEEASKLTLLRQFYPTLILEGGSGICGGEVTVNVFIKHNPGFAGLEYRINYDSAVASYVSGKSNTNNFFSQFSPSEGANPVKAVLANLSLKNISGDISLATITFKIADDVLPGKYPITLSDFKCYDADIVGIKMTVADSVITVE